MLYNICIFASELEFLWQSSSGTWPLLNILFLIIFILLDFGFYSLILSTILNIIVTTLYDLFKVYKLVFLNNK